MCPERPYDVLILGHQNLIVEDGQTSVVRQTSVDSCEPVDSFSVNLVTRRLVYKSVLTARLCSFHNERFMH